MTIRCTQSVKKKKTKRKHSPVLSEENRNATCRNWQNVGYGGLTENLGCKHSTTKWSSVWSRIRVQCVLRVSLIPNAARSDRLCINWFVWVKNGLIMCKVNYWQLLMYLLISDVSQNGCKDKMSLYI